MISCAVLKEEFQADCPRTGTRLEAPLPLTKSWVLLLVSTQGHCLNDLLHRSQSSSLPIEVAAVVSNHTALSEMTQWYKLPFYHWPIEKSKEEQEEKIASLISREKIDLIVLARYMQILSPI